MAHALGVGPQEAGDSGGTAQITLTGCTAGRSIVILTWWASSTVTISSLTCSGETIVSKTLRTNAGLPIRHQIHYIENIQSSGNKVIDITWSGSLSGAARIWAREIDGGDTAGWFDAEGTATGTGTNAKASLTTTVDGDFVIAITTSNSDDSGWTDETGFTTATLGDSNWWDDATYDLDVGAAGSKSPGFTLGSSANFLTTAAAFKLASGGSPPSPKLFLSLGVGK